MGLPLLAGVGFNLSRGDSPREDKFLKGLGKTNVLLITTDQQFAGALSCAGNPWLRTPAMDRLASGGVRFEKVYCPNPICVPSRTAYMTGTHSHQTGVFYNRHTHEETLDKNRFPCLAQYFKTSGYRTGHFGKWHIPASLEDAEWSGFDSLGAMRDNEVDHDIVDSCVRFIDDCDDQPFFAVASFVNPHDICEYARILSGIEDRLRNGELGSIPDISLMPEIPANFLPPRGEPTAIRDHYNDPKTGRVYPTRNWTARDSRWRQYLWGYYRMTEIVDRRIGQLLDALEQRGLAENTVVALTSDHGDGMGCHNWNQKTMFYDQCSRVPFILSAPFLGIEAGVDHTTLGQIGTDLFPTLLDAAGIAVPPSLQGISLLGAARRKSDFVGHKFIVSQNNLQSQYGSPGQVNGRMLRSRRYKYVVYDGGDDREQLFDMELDPLETVDLSLEKASSSVLEEHRSLLKSWLREKKDDFKGLN